MKYNSHECDPIDAVVTWVDGSDPNHLAKRRARLNALGLCTVDASSTRFASNGELEYCLLSMVHYAPWIRTIYLVTDQQTPDFLIQAVYPELSSRVQCVDHQTIFNGFSDCLPTFNSLSIESMLWRIPHLSERWIYFNDDCLLIRPTTPADFFSDQRVIIRGHWSRFRRDSWVRKLRDVLHRSAPRWFKAPSRLDAHRAMQEKSALWAGYPHRLIHLDHVPFAFVQSMFAQAFQRDADWIHNNSRAPFRQEDQYWIISCLYHEAFRNHRALLLSHRSSMMINGATHSERNIKHRLSLIQNNPNIKFLCMQSLDQATPRVQRIILDWVRQRIGTK